MTFVFTVLLNLVSDSSMPIKQHFYRCVGVSLKNILQSCKISLKDFLKSFC